MIKSIKKGIFDKRFDINDFCFSGSQIYSKIEVSLKITGTNKVDKITVTIFLLHRLH